VLDRIYHGELMVLLGRTADFNWYYISTRRRVLGWIRAEPNRFILKSKENVPVIAEDTAGQVPEKPGPLATLDWEPHSIGEGTLLLPPSWRGLPLEEAALGQLASQSAASNPDLAQAIREISDKRLYEGADLLAVDPQPGGASVTLVAMAQPRPGDQAGMDKAKGRMVQFLSQMRLGKLLDSHMAKWVKGIPAQEFVFEVLEPGQTSPATRSMIQWMVSAPNHIYVLYFLGPPSIFSKEPGHWVDLSEDIVLSLNPGGPSEGDTSK